MALENIGTLIYKIIDKLDPEEMKKAGLDANYTQHGRDVYPHNAAGYEHLINLTDDKGVIETLSFLREREVVHFQRFGECLRLVQEWKDSKKWY